MTFCRNEQHYGSGERSVENADALEGPSVVISKGIAYIVLLAKRREKVNHINNQFREDFSCCDATLSRPSCAGSIASIVPANCVSPKTCAPTEFNSSSTKKPCLSKQHHAASCCRSSMYVRLCLQATSAVPGGGVCVLRIFNVRYRDICVLVCRWSAA